MLTLMDHPTPAPATLCVSPMPTLPSATYDFDGCTIYATIIVSPPADKPIIHSCPLVTRAPQQGFAARPWTVIWNFVVDPSLIDTYSVNIPPEGTILPNGVMLFQKGPREWVITVSSDQAAPALRSFEYDILVEATMRPLEVHDPTIVVTKDPII